MSAVTLEKKSKKGSVLTLLGVLAAFIAARVRPLIA